MTSDRPHDVPVTPNRRSCVMSHDDVELWSGVSAPVPCSRTASAVLLIPLVCLMVFAAYCATPADNGGSRQARSADPRSQARGTAVEGRTGQ